MRRHSAHPATRGPTAAVDDPAVLARVLRASRDVVSLVGLDGTCLYTSPSCRALIGWSPEELVGRSAFDHVHPDDLYAVQEAMKRLVVTDAPLVLRFRMVHRSGHAVWVEASAQPPEQGSDAFGVGLRDITERLELEELLWQAAVHDPVTGLANRRLLDDELEAAVARAERSKGQLAVVFVDLDGFKRLNDVHGHAAGDAVLQSVARRLRDSVRAGDLAARYGGDEFVAVLIDVADAAEVDAMLTRLRAAMREPVHGPGGPHHVSASIGVAVWQPGMTGEDLLARADHAMYDDKRR